MVPEFFYIFENLELRQVVRISRHLTSPSTSLATYVTEVVVLAIVQIKPIHIVEEKVGAKCAFFMISIDMILKRLVLIQFLFEHKHWFAVQAKLAKINFMPFYIMIAKVLQGWKSTGGLASFTRVTTKLAAIAYLFSYFSPNLLSCKDNPILRVFNTLANICLGGSFRVGVLIICGFLYEAIVGIICD